MFCFHVFQVRIGPRDGKDEECLGAAGFVGRQQFDTLVQLQRPGLTDGFPEIVLEFKGAFVSHKSGGVAIQIKVGLANGASKETKGPPGKTAVGSKGNKKDQEEGYQVSQAAKEGPQEDSGHSVFSRCRREGG